MAKYFFALLIFLCCHSFAGQSCDNIYSVSNISTQRQFFKDASTTTVRELLKKAVSDESPQWIFDISRALVPENAASVVRVRKELSILAGEYSAERLQQLQPLFHQALKLASYVQKNNYPQREVTKLFLTYTHLVDARRRNRDNREQIENSINQFVSAFMHEGYGYKSSELRYYGKYLFTFENPSRLDFVRARAAGYSLVGISTSDLNAFDTIENQTSSFFARHDLIHASRELQSDHQYLPIIYLEHGNEYGFGSAAIVKMQKENLRYIKNILQKIELIQNAELRTDLSVLLFYLTHEAYLNLKNELNGLFADKVKLQTIKHNLANEIYFGTLGPRLKTAIPVGEDKRVEEAFKVLQKML